MILLSETNSIEEKVKFGCEVKRERFCGRGREREREKNLMREREANSSFLRYTSSVPRYGYTFTYRQLYTSHRVH